MIENWNDADNKLREIAVIDVVVKDALTRKAAALLVVEEAYKAETKAPLERKAAAEAELEAFYKANRKKVEAEGKRSVELNFGRLGMRKGNPTLKLAKGWKWERVLAAIKERWARNTDMLASLVNTKETVNKDGCKSRLDEEKLALIGLRIGQDDEFFYETFPEKVEKGRAA